MRSREKKKVNKRVFVLIFLIVFVLLGAAGIGIWKYLNVGIQVVTSNKIELKQTEEKRINLLLLGAGGGSHEGPDLTDTIIFASIDPKSKKTLLVSVPRDLWVSELNIKVNTAYVYGEERQKGSGLQTAKKIVSGILGQKIDYAVKVDFDAFVTVIDLIGGVDIDIERSFDDFAYPVSGLRDDPCGHTEEEIASLSAQLASQSADISESQAFPCRYEHLHFDKGLTHMDGETALKFVRSRHAIGQEGSDFARSKRQEKVISAVKDKIFSLGLLANPGKIIEIAGVMQAGVTTDIREDEFDDFVRLAGKFKSGLITSIVLATDGSGSDNSGLLLNPPLDPVYGNQWILVPKAGNGDFSEIHKYIDCEITVGNCSPTATPTPSI